MKAQDISVHVSGEDPDITGAWRACLEKVTKRFLLAGKKLQVYKSPQRPMDRYLVVDGNPLGRMYAYELDAVDGSKVYTVTFTTNKS